MMKRTIAVIVVMIVSAASAFAGGNKQAGTAGTSTAATARNLGGIDITIGYDNHDWDVNTFVPTSTTEEATLAWRRKIQKDYNFTIREKNLFHWDYYGEQWNNALAAGKPLSQIFYVQGAGVQKYYQQGWLMALQDIPGLDITKNYDGLIWDQSAMKALTYNGKTYAWIANPGSGKRGKGLMFNKRLLLQAGVDPDYIYDMQKAGTWTWDAFTALCQELMKDTDNDGKIDVYAVTGLSLQAWATSNGATFVDFDPAVGFVNATSRPEFIEAFQYYHTLAKNYQGGNFMQGSAVFYALDEESISRNDTMEFQNFTDDWGWVVYPKGPKATDYYVYTRDDVMGIPKFYTPAEYEKFMIGYRLWMQPAPEVGVDGWKQSEYHFYRDSRAVDETLAIMRNPNNCRYPIIYQTPCAEWDIPYWNVNKTPQELIESVRAAWAAKLAEYNKIIGK